jgi:ferric-dicitrate binding protein FerR (iron transport regulator)
LSIEFSNYSLDDDAVSKLWNRIHHLGNTSSRSQKRGYDLFFKVAAAATLILMVGLMYYYSAPKPWKEYRTQFGQTLSIRLPDSSLVILNANSRLTLMSDWEHDPKREIWLDGEAFFSVVHKLDDKIFKVHTREGVTVEVLGTKFNVYNRKNATKVVLNSGQIRLNIPTEKVPETIVMEPGEMIEYKAKHYQKKSVDPKLYSAWTDNRIILNHTSLREMTNMLKDNYGLEVIVRDTSLLSQTVSGSMPLGDDDILIRQLAKAFQLKISRENNSILIEEP